MERLRTINLLLGTALLTGCAGSIGPTKNPDSPTFIPTPLTETFVPTETFFPPTETPFPTSTVETRIPYLMFGIDFADLSQEVKIEIRLRGGHVFNLNSFAAVCETIDTYSTHFAPGENSNSCEYQPRNDPDDMFHFIHSGWFHKPEANGSISYYAATGEALRHFLEDLSYSPDIQLSLSQIKKNINDLLGASVEITQGENTATDLKVLSVVRVPPDQLGAFAEGSQLSNENVMATLAKIDHSTAQFANDGKPQIIIIFCGWYIPEERDLNPGANVAEHYAWSRYAVIIGK